jgi:hypothetical protein
MAKTALTKAPKVEGDPKKAKALERYNTAVAKLKRLDLDDPRRNRWNNIINQYGPQTGKQNWQGALQTPPGKKVHPRLSVDEEWKLMTPEQRTGALQRESGQLGAEVIQQGQQFDWTKGFGQYQEGFGAARDKAYQDVMNQFNQTMEPEFKRQNAELQQRLYDQGIDPVSGAYQAQVKQLADAQNSARQNAMGQASERAYAVQQQAFGQGQQAFMTPAQIWAATNQPYLTGLQQTGQIDLQKLQGQQAMEQAKLQGEQAKSVASIGAGASMANTQAQIAAQQEQWRRENIAALPQQPQSQGGGFGGGFMSALPVAITSGANQRR